MQETQVNYLGIWTILIRNALLQHSDSEINRFVNSVRGLTTSLLSTERNKVKKYIKTLTIDDKTERTLVILEYIIDVLCKAGFLTKEKILEEGNIDMKGTLDD